MNKHLKVVTVLVCVLLASTGIMACNSGNNLEIERPKPEKPDTDGTLKLNVATYNIRLRTTSDQGDKDWVNRRDWARKIIKDYDFDIFGTQEGFKDQIDYLLGAGSYAYIGVGRDDGINGGEHSAIIYKKDRFDVLDKGNFWLSETPDKPSAGWDATIKRICSWGKFRDKLTKKEFFFFNAHYDHQGTTAQLESSKLIVKKLKEIAGDAPVFFTGDLNVMPTTESVKELLNSGLLLDSRNSSAKPVYGTEGTFHGYNLDGKTTQRIDYIFVSKGIRVASYGVINDDIKTGKFSSDHFPVLVNAEL